MRSLSRLVPQPGEMTRTSAAGLLIQLCLVSLSLSYDIFCNDLYNCQREALGEADNRYNPLFLHPLHPLQALQPPDKKKINVDGENVQ